MPTASQILDLMDGMQRSDLRRHKLASTYSIFKACTVAGLLNDDSIDWLAQRLQELHGEGLVAFGRQSGSADEPIVWDGSWLQSLHDWRVTSKGRADADLYRRQADAATAGLPARADTGADRAGAQHSHDVFLSHASEDNQVVRQLEQALVALGWRVWLDELELTIGDSLSGRIDAALVQSRFGVVVLSPAFFSKDWPQRELAGLAAREVDAGTKVILPVWHNVDRHYVAQRSPILADRLGALTSAGIHDVAQKLSVALRRAGDHPARRGSAALVQSVSVDEDDAPAALLGVPKTRDEQTRLLVERPAGWEYLLFCGVLVQGKDLLEPKWHDHELRLPRGPRRDLDQASLFDYLQRELAWFSAQVEAGMRVLEPSVQERAFGAPGESGDPVRIEHVALRLVQTYESMLDWAASLRNISAPEIFAEVLESVACIADQPVREMRQFIAGADEAISRLPELLADATTDDPITMRLDLVITIDEATQARVSEAMRRAGEALTHGD